MIRVFLLLLLDDHEIVRRGVRDLIKSADDLEVVGEAGTAAEALQRVPATSPDVAVLDVRLPDANGVEVCRDLRSASDENGAGFRRWRPRRRCDSWLGRGNALLRRPRNEVERADESSDCPIFI